ncbi:hypothetical protein [Bacillus thuringiensis]|uniref:hypothetical protein n=1 Tax=Bacillus thuringiensis TaxID=1428 RepID=UPI001CA55B07|nr:hypothetical protein [Bacillus thuringiensis]
MKLKKKKCGIISKIIAFNFILISLGSLLSTYQHGVYAATNINSTNETAETFINVTAPTTNNLYLKENPDFDFGSSQVSSANITLNAQGSSTYTIVNLSGTSNGYQLQQQVSEFTGTDTSGKTITLPLKYFYISVASNAEGTITGSSNVNIYGQNAAVLVGGANARGTQSSGDVTAQLILDNRKNVSAGNYHATITSSLVSGV